MKGLTEKQARMLGLIRDYYRQHGQGPSYRELCRLSGLTLCTVYRHVEALVRKGYLLRGEPFQHRGLRPVDVDPLPAQLVTLESVVRACHAQGSREIRRLCEQALPDLAGGAL